MSVLSSKLVSPNSAEFLVEQSTHFPTTGDCAWPKFVSHPSFFVIKVEPLEEEDPKPEPKPEPEPKPKPKLESILRWPVTRESNDFTGSPLGSPRPFRKFHRPPELDMCEINSPLSPVGESSPHYHPCSPDLIQEYKTADLSPKTLHDLSKTLHPLAFLCPPSPKPTSPLYPRTPEQSDESVESVESVESDEPLRRSKRVRPMTPKGEGAYVPQGELSADLPSSVSFLFLHEVRFVSPEFIFRASGSGPDGDFDGLFLASEFEKYNNVPDHGFVGNALREAMKVYNTVKRNFSQGSAMGNGLFEKFHKVVLSILAADKRRRVQMGVAPPARYTGHAVRI